MIAADVLKAWIAVLRPAPVLRLRVTPTALHAEARLRGDIVWAGETAYDSLEDLTDAIARLAAEPPDSCRRVSVSLASPLVQLRTIPDLPPVRPDALAAIVANQPGRFFRKNGVPLVTGAVWAARNGGPRHACAAAVSEPVVHAILAGTEAAGLTLETIESEGPGPPLALLPESERAVRHRRSSRRFTRLVVAASIAWAAAGATYVWRLESARTRTALRMGALQEPLAAVRKAREELSRTEATVRAAQAAATSQGRALATLAAVAQNLPDSAVLTSIALHSDGTGVLSGLARSASAAVTRLDRSRGVEGVRLQGPVTREQIAGREWERFTAVFRQVGTAR